MQRPLIQPRPDSSLTEYVLLQSRFVENSLRWERFQQPCNPSTWSPCRFPSTLPFLGIPYFEYFHRQSIYPALTIAMSTIVSPKRQSWHLETGVGGDAAHECRMRASGSSLDISSTLKALHYPLWMQQLWYWDWLCIFFASNTMYDDMYDVKRSWKVTLASALSCAQSTCSKQSARWRNFPKIITKSRRFPRFMEMGWFSKPRTTKLIIFE